MFKKILLVIVLAVLMFIPFGAVQSGQPFHDEGASCLIDPCDCCFDNVRIEVGDYVYDLNNVLDAHWDISITPLKDGKPVKVPVMLKAYIWSSAYGDIYGHEEFQLSELNIDSNVVGLIDVSGNAKQYNIFWHPDFQYTFRITGFDYENTIHLIIELPSGCLVISPPMVMDFGTPPEPN